MISGIVMFLSQLLVGLPLCMSWSDHQIHNNHLHVFPAGVGSSLSVSRKPYVSVGT